MPKKRADTTPASPDYFFAEELAGEEPPSSAAMKRLYERASDLFGFRPWQILSESELVVTHGADEPSSTASRPTRLEKPANSK